MEDEETLAYRVYVTDAINLQAQGKCIRERWINLINRKVDTRTADEVAADVIKNAGLIFQRDE